MLYDEKEYDNSQRKYYYDLETSETRNSESLEAIHDFIKNWADKGEEDMELSD